MSNAVAKVSFLQGQAWAKAPDGTLRALTVGSTLHDDEVLVTAQGARVELDVGSVEPLVVNGGLEVGMSRDFLADNATGADEALLSDATVQEALTVLEQGGDLLEELEETAAGDNGGGGSNDGHSFVQLTRVIEQTDPQAFSYESSSTGTLAAVENDANDTYTNSAPLVTDQVLASDEDEVVTGQIIATDVEDDAITYTLTTAPANGTLVLDPLTGQFTFTPNANYNGADSFVVTVTDSRGNSSITTITLNIAPVNDAPTSNDLNLTTDEDTPVNGQVVAQDIENDTLSYVVSGQPANGTVTLDPATGSFIYTPNANYNGSDSFVVTISDGNGGTTTSTVTIGINPVNDAPVSNDQNLVTDEDVAVSGQVVASDVDGDTLGYNVSGQPTNGSVTLDPATGSFVYTPNANYNGSDSFVVTISDGKGGTTTSTINIGINPVNDAPVSNDQNLVTPEDAPLPGQVVASDVEGDVLAYAVSGQPTNGSVTLDPATGSFVYTPNANYNGSDSFVVTISDGNGGTTTSTINIGVTPVNDAPVSSNLSLTTPEDTPVSSQVSASDVDGDSLSYSVSGNPANGSVVLNAATGSFTYTPNTNYNGSDSFVVTISDGKGGTTTSVVSIGVTPVNDAPVAGDQSFTTDENIPVSSSISLTASDPDGDTLSYSVTGAPANGTVVLNPATGSYTYTPNTGYSGSDNFVVTVSDGNGGTSTSTVTIGVNAVNNAPETNDISLTSPTGGIRITLSGSDTDGTVTGYVIKSLPANGVLRAGALGGGPGGSLIDVGDMVTGPVYFYPTPGRSGSTGFSYAAVDNSGAEDATPANVSITVTSPPNAVLSAGTGSVKEDTPAQSSATGTLTISDPDAGEAVFIAQTNVTGYTSSYGYFSIDAAGAWVFNIDNSKSDVQALKEGETRWPRFLVMSIDGTTTEVTVHVIGTNDAPVANDDTASVDEGNSAVIAARGNDSDPDGDSLTVTSVTQGANGSVVIDPITNSLVYTPSPGFSGTDSFTYTIDDGNGGNDTATVTVTVNPVANTAPVAVADSFIVAEGGTLNGVAYDVLLNDSDADVGDTLTAILVAGPTNGSLTLNANGKFTYIHNGSETTNDSFTYKVNDGTVDGNTVTVSINVTPVNDAPVAVADTFTVAEGGTLTVTPANKITLNDTDADSSSLTAVLVTSPAHGSLTLNADGTFTYIHNGSETATDIFTYKANDGADDSNIVTVTINVTPVNDAPVANDDTATVLEDGSVTIAVRTNDTDAEGSALTVSIQSQGTNGSVTLDPVSGNPVYTPNSGFSGTDSFTYTVSDASGAVSNIATVTVTVTDINHAPVAVADTFTVAEGGVLTVTAANKITLNDTDAEGDLLSAILVTGPSNGTLTLNANGTFTYIHNGSETTSDSFTYKVNDGTSDSNTVTVSINVAPVNDAPVAVADAFTVAEGGTLTVTPANKITANDTDADSGTLTAVLVTGPAHGTLTLNADGTFTYIHDGSETTSDSFTYKANDGIDDSNIVTVTINVTPVNDAPETNAVTATGDEDTLITVSLSGSDSDGTVAGFVIKSLPANGLLYTDATMATVISIGDLVTGPVYFLPTTDWNGNTSFSYAARDNSGAEDATPATATITVNSLADAAVLGSGAGSVKEDTAAQSSASGVLSIVDPDAGEAAFQAQTNTAGTYGTFSIDAAGSWIYNIDNTKPAVQVLKEGETKTETFTVTSIDGTTTSVVITVNGTNDGPVATADTASVNQDAVLTLTPAQLLGNDTDLDGDTLTIDSVQAAVNGSVSIVGGNVVFTPTPGYHGAASFTYTITDGHDTSTATVSVTVDKTNTAPVANDDAAAPTGTGNLGLVSEYFGYQEPANGANLTSIGQVYSFIDGRTPDATFVAKTFDYSAATFTNGLGTGTNLQTFLGSDAASLSADPATTTDAIIRMRGFVELGAGTYNFKVLGDDGYQIRVDGVVVAERNLNQSATTTTHNQFTVSAGGLHSIEIIYWDQAGSAKLKLELSDDAGATYDILSSIPNYKATTFSAVEDTALSLSVTSLLGNDTDADGDTLTIQSVQGAVNGTVSLVAGSIIFTPAANYSGPASFTYTISDGKGGTDTATVNLSVVAVNDAPAAVNDTLVIAPDRVTAIPVATLLANDSDVDGDRLTLVSVQSATNGTAVLTNGEVRFTPTANFEGTASFTYTVRDDKGLTSTATANLTVASVTAPSVVVNKAILINAQGTAGASVDFPIITRLVDNDGSETLSVRISGVPTGVAFSAGVNTGGGVWNFTQSDLANLKLTVPGSFSLNTYGIVLTVAVTSTEATNNSTATTSTTVRLFADYTTTSLTTTENGDVTATSADDFIQGGSGNNTITGGSGNDLIYGGAGNDTLHGGDGVDVVYGEAGNDIIYGGAGVVGSDRISGGAGNDILSGGAIGATAHDGGADVFVWSLGDQGIAGAPAVDTINYFGTGAATANTSGDILDLRDLLQGESVGAANSAGNLADYLHFEVSGSDTIIHISHTGGFTADSHSVGGSYTSTAETQQIVLSGVNLQSVYSGATTDQQIITQLLNNNKLITD